MKTTAGRSIMKVIKPFVFKQFTVNQDRCALKVNTDAVLLGALAEANHPRKILDIGAGTGVVSLMLAQRYNGASIYGVEIEDNAYLQAHENFSYSLWSERMKMYHMPFQELGLVINDSYDLIVSNPPYYTDHLKTRNHERNLALHSESLSFEELSDGVRGMLSPIGKFYVILPERQMKLLEQCLAERGLYPHSKMTIFDRPGSQTLRVVQSFGFQADVTPIYKKIFIKDSAGNYSSEYSSLLKDFLLIF